MHRARFVKVILSKEVTSEISNQRCLHIKRLELVNTYIQETEIFISTMARERNQCRNETCSVELDRDNSRQQITVNNATLDEDINILNNVNEYGQNGEAGDSNRRSRNIDAAVQYDGNLSFLVSGTDNTSNFSKSNNIVSETCELSGFDGTEKIGVADIVPMNKIAATFVLSGSKLNNSQNCIKKSNQANKSNDCSYSTENVSCPNYKAKQIPPKFHDGRRKMKHHGTENKFTDTSTRSKLDKLKKDDTNNILFPVTPQKERNVSKSEPNQNIISDSDAFKTPRYFEDVVPKNADDDCKRIEAGMKVLNEDNIALSGQEDMKNNIKKCRSCCKIVDNEKTWDQVGSETVSRSVTDLITYFENLCPIKQPNVKSKIKSFESKQSLMKDRILNVGRVVKSNATPPSSTQKDLNISSKTDDAKKSVVKQREVILLDSDTDNRKTPAEVVPENILLDINTDDRKENNEASPNVDFPHLNNGVNKRSIEIISKKYVPDLNTRTCQNMLSRSTEFSNCNFCKGNREHFEQDINRSDDNTSIVKEHKFIFSDDGFNDMEQPRKSYPRRFRSRFTRKHTSPVYPRSLRDLENSRNDKESGLNFISCNRKENLNILPGNKKQTAVRNGTTHGSLNLSPLIQNSIEVRKHEGKYISERKKLKSTDVGSNVKRIIGIVFAVVISIVIYKGVSENYKLW